MSFIPKANDLWLHFVTIVVALTGTIVFTFRDASLKHLCSCMFLPAICAIMLESYRGGFYRFISQLLFGNQEIIDNSVIVKACVKGIGSVLLYLLCVGVLVVSVEWGKFTSFDSITIPFNFHFFVLILLGFLRTVGEEVGWRCFLVPSLYARGYSFLEAALICGSAWGLFHVPIMLVETGWDIRMVAVQSTAVLCSCSIYNRYSEDGEFTLWPSSLMHTTWNIVNPFVFGDVYAGKPGKVIEGEAWLVNGEALGGVCVGVLATCMLGICAGGSGSRLKGYSRV